MKRREVLAATGTIAIAGCLSSGADGSPSDGDGDGNESPDTGGGEGSAPTVDTTVTSAMLETRETAAGVPEAAVTGTIENTGDARLGAVTAVGRFYNADGQLLSTAQWDIRDFAPGEVWEPWIPYTGDVERVAQADLAVSNTIAHGRTVSPEGFVLESSDIQIPVDDYAMPRVVGEVTNESGRDAPILLVRPKVYAENGHLLETGIKTIQRIGAGESRQFDIQVHFNNGAWKDRIGDHDVVLTV